MTFIGSTVVVMCFSCLHLLLFLLMLWMYLLWSVVVGLTVMMIVVMKFVRTLLAVFHSITPGELPRILLLLLLRVAILLLLDRIEIQIVQITTLDPEP